MALASTWRTSLQHSIYGEPLASIKYRASK
jgi:hypothetical protein